MSCEAHLEEAEDCEEEEGGEPPEGGKPPWVACWLHLQAKIYIISWSWHSLWVPWLCACQCSRRGPWRCCARTVGPWRRRPPCAGRLRKLPWCLPPGPPGRGNMGVDSICWRSLCTCIMLMLSNPLVRVGQHCLGERQLLLRLPHQDHLKVDFSSKFISKISLCTAGCWNWTGLVERSPQYPQSEPATKPPSRDFSKLEISSAST